MSSVSRSRNKNNPSHEALWNSEDSQWIKKWDEEWQAEWIFDTQSSYIVVGKYQAFGPLQFAILEKKPLVC